MQRQIFTQVNGSVEVPKLMPVPGKADADTRTNAHLLLSAVTHHGEKVL